MGLVSDPKVNADEKDKHMDADLKQKWVEALRSGRYQQGKKFLRYTSVGYGDQYCCLGVLCEISGLAKWQAGPGEEPFMADFGNEKSDDLIPEGAMEKLGLSQVSHDHLWWLNDHGGSSFPFIADWIERNL